MINGILASLVAITGNWSFIFPLIVKYFAVSLITREILIEICIERQQNMRFMASECDASSSSYQILKSKNMKMSFSKVLGCAATEPI